MSQADSVKFVVWNVLLHQIHDLDDGPMDLHQTMSRHPVKERLL